MKDFLCLNVGCGLVAPPTWVNIDASFNAWLARFPRLRKTLARIKPLQAKLSIPWPPNISIHDIRQGIPYPSGSVAAVYASHLLEHLYVSDAHFFLEECYRVLRQGGILRVVVPDLAAYVRRYIDTRSSNENSANDFMGAILTCPDLGRSGWLKRIIRAANDLHSHKWMYDSRSLAHLIRQKGFSEPSPRGFLESRIPAIADVEQEDRFRDSVCIEATK